MANKHNVARANNGDKAPREDYQVFIDGKFNHRKPPKDYNYAYGACIKDYRNVSVFVFDVKVADSR
jgi:hypothetical protein